MKRLTDAEANALLAERGFSKINLNEKAGGGILILPSLATCGLASSGLFLAWGGFMAGLRYLIGLAKFASLSAGVFETLCLA